MDDRDPEEINEFETLKRKALDAIPEIFQSTSWAPPEGSVLIEAVVCMIWMQPDGKVGRTTFPATNHWWSTYGILKDAVWNHEHVDGRGTSEPDEY